MPAADPASPEEIQRRIGARRDRLLAGRGPGASPDETALYMRDRQQLGGVPAAVARQQEADQAALAADDLPAIDDVLIRRRAELATTLTALTRRLRTLRARTVTGLRAGLIAAAAGTAAALAARAALRRSNSHAQRSPQPPPGARGHRASIGGHLPGSLRTAGNDRPRIVTRRLRRAYPRRRHS